MTIRIIILVLSLFWISCSSSQSRNEVSLSPTEGQETSLAKEEISTPSSKSDALSPTQSGLINGHRIFLTQGLDPYSSGTRKPDIGYRFVALRIFIENVAGVSDTLKELRIVLVDKEGNIHQKELNTSNLSPVLRSTRLGRGGYTEGWLMFQVREGVTFSHLLAKEGNVQEIRFKADPQSLLSIREPTKRKSETTSADLSFNQKTTVRGLDVVINGVEDPFIPYADRFGKGSRSQPAPDGCRYVGVRLGKSSAPIGTDNFLLMDNEGHYLPPSFVAIDGKSFQRIGTSSVSGEEFLVFMIPERMKASAIRFDPYYDKAELVPGQQIITGTVLVKLLEVRDPYQGPQDPYKTPYRAFRLSVENQGCQNWSFSPGSFVLAYWGFSPGNFFVRTDSFDDRGEDEVVPRPPSLSPLLNAFPRGIMNPGEKVEGWTAFLKRDAKPSYSYLRYGYGAFIPQPLWSTIIP